MPDGAGMGPLGVRADGRPRVRAERLIWDPAMEQSFLVAVERAGGLEECTPTQVAKQGACSMPACTDSWCCPFDCPFD